MTEQEQFEFNEIKEQNKYLLTWFNYFKRMENSERNANNFHSIVAGRPISTLITMMSEENQITITYEKGSERGELFLIAKNSKSEWKVLTPFLDRPSANTPFRSNQGANFQRILDYWADILKDNIECWAKYYKQNITVKIEIPCLYQPFMWYHTYKGDEAIAHIHPYLEKQHPLAFKELKEQLTAEGYTVKVELFEEDN